MLSIKYDQSSPFKCTAIGSEKLKIHIDVNIDIDI